ncbi:MAG: BACON domain-containing carbohydrate-binding protein [Bryobacteraceae bacterium]
MRTLAAMIAVAAAAHAEGMWFEENRGQVRGEVRFFARGPGYHLYLHPASATAVTFGAAGEAPRVVTMEFAGARGDAAMEGLEETADRSNYFVGNDRARWIRGLSHYRSVAVRGVWQGVDVRYYESAAGTIEHDFVIAPGADAGQVRFRIPGAELAADGSLRAGGMRWVAPVAYQMAGGERRAVESQYVLGDGGAVSIALGAYDRGRELVIDPEMVFAKYVGGSNADPVADIAYRPVSGELVMVGYTKSVDLPVVNAFQSSPRGNDDAFILRTSPSGTRFFTYLGGSDQEAAGAVALDAAGNAYVAGATSSADFPGATLSSGAGAFVAKLTPDGALVYSARIGGVDAGVSGIAVDAAGAAYVAGASFLGSLATTPGALQPAPAGDADAVVLKLNPSGTALEYATYLGGSGADWATGIAVSASGEAFTAGVTDSVGLATAGALRQAPAGGRDGFVARLNASGSAKIYFTYYGGSGTDSVNAIALDGNAAIIGGSTSSADLPVASAVQGTLQGILDGFAAVLNSSGSAVTMATYLGGAGIDSVSAIAAVNAQSIVVAGNADPAGFPVVNPLFNGPQSGQFLAWIRANPNYGFEFSTLLPMGSSLIGEAINGIAIDPADVANHMYVAGGVSNIRFPADRRISTESAGGATPDPGNLGFYARVRAGSGLCMPEFWADPSADGRTVVLRGTGAGAVLKVRSPGDCNWTLGIPAAASWLTVGRTSGAGIEGIGVTAPPNPGPARSAVLTISPGGTSVTVTQPAAGCMYTFNPPVVRLGTPGTMEVLQLNTEDGCAWQVPSSLPPWFTLQQTAGTPGVGPAAFILTAVGTSPIGVAYDLELGPAPGTVNIRRGACGIRFQGGTDRVQFGAQAATVPVTVAAADGCAWNAQRDIPGTDWLTLTPSSGVGPRTAQLSVTANTTLSARAGGFAFGGVSLLVAQQEAEGTPAAACTYRVTPGARSYDYFGGTGRFDVETQPGCRWRATGSGARILTPPAESSGPGEVTYTVSFNDRLTLRGRQIFIENPTAERVATFTALLGPIHPRLPVVLPYEITTEAVGGPFFSTPRTVWHFRAADPVSGGNIEEIRVRIGAWRDDPERCEFAYRRSTNTLTLEGGQPASGVPGAAGILTAGACQIDLQASTVTTDENLMELKPGLLLLGASALRSQAVYESVTSSGGAQATLSPAGVTGLNMIPPGSPRVFLESPEVAGFDRDVFQFVARDETGASNIQAVSVLINDTLDPKNACYFGYHRASNTILLVNDEATGYMNPLALGSGGAIQNRQCRIEDTGPQPSAIDALLRLAVNVRFLPRFSGSRVVFSAVQSASGTSAWRPVGFYRVQPQ